MIWPKWGLNLQSTALEASTLSIPPQMQFIFKGHDRNYHWGKWGNCLTKKSVNFFDKWFTKVSCVSFYVDFVQVVSRCSNRITVSLFRMLLYVGLYSASNRIHPSFSNIISLRDVVIHVTLTTLLVRNGYLAENRVLSKKKQVSRIRFVQVVSCNFHTQTTYTSKKL